MSAQGTPLGPKFFVLGTFVQSEGMMDTWKARGINTLVEFPHGANVDQWTQSAASKGLYMIRAPSSNLNADLNNPYLLAWAQTDEPSNTTSTLDYGRVTLDPAEILAQASSWRAAASAQGKFMPVWANHVGGHIYPDWAVNNALMKDYMAGPESDWLSNDSYPIQEHQPFVVKAVEGYTSTTQGITLDRQAAWSSGKPVMAFIGTSKYNDSNDIPSVGEFKAMAWSSVIHGASGINYFTVDLSPWAWDATPPELVQAMTAFNKEIAAIDKILMNETKGGRDPFTLFKSANSGAAPKSDQLPYPFEAAEIKNETGTYRIILNLTDQPQVLNKPEWGINNVTFSGFEVKKGYANGASPAPSVPTTPTVPTNPAPETPAPAPTPAEKSLTLRVSSDHYQGAATFDVVVDGKVVATNLTATAKHGSGWSDVVVKGQFAADPKSVSVVFKNDAWGGSAATDRNLYVDSLTINGKTYQGEAFGNKAADPSAAALFSNGSLTFTLNQTSSPTPPVTTPPVQPTPVPPNPVPTTPAEKSLTLRVSSDHYQGAATFDVVVDGKVVATNLTATAKHGSGWSDVVVKGQFAADPKSVSVVFKNDAWGGSAATDRNLYVDSLTINGKTYQGEAFGNKAADPSAAALFSNGSLTFTLNQTAAPTPPAPAQPAQPTVPTDALPKATITGTDVQNIINGTAGHDTIHAKAGADVINAGLGDDKVVGGLDKDWMSGQSGADIFIFQSVKDSTVDQHRDVINDFGFGKDKIDLQLIDAHSTATGNQAFAWIGTKAFSGRAGELHAFENGSNTFVEGDTNGDGKADFQIQLNKYALQAQDFVL